MRAGVGGYRQFSNDRGKRVNLNHFVRHLAFTGSAICLSLSTPPPAAAQDLPQEIPTSCGPVSRYYLISGDAIEVVQGRRLWRFLKHSKPNTNDDVTNTAYAPAVRRDMVRLAPHTRDSKSETYTFNGVLQESPDVKWGTSIMLFDGAVDSDKNYGIDFYSGNVIRFNADWTFEGATPHVLFCAQGVNSEQLGTWTGITYDRTAKTFWVATYSGGNVWSFVEGTEGDWVKDKHFKPEDAGLGTDVHATAVAFDAADGTIWVNYQVPGKPSELRNFAPDGRCIGKLRKGDLKGNSCDECWIQDGVWGGEFEPSLDKEYELNN